jgi:hypothetical protein
MGRLLKEVRACVECTASFRPSHKQQIACSRNCSGRRRARLHPRTAAMDKAWAATQAKARAARLARVKGLTASQLWSKAYQAGYSAGWLRGRRGAA